MAVPTINYLAVLVATLASFVIGGLWYSPALFANAWMKETGLTDEQLKKRSMGMVFGLAFLLTLIMAVNLAVFLSAGPPDLVWGMAAGALAGIGWIGLAFSVTYLFESKSLKLLLINAGYHAVSFTVMGAIIGVWK